jgi:hypothetical protein
MQTRRRAGDARICWTSRLACVLAIASVIAAGVAACGSGSAPGPLAADVAQKASASCVPAPNLPDIKAWNTHIGFALDMFVNVSRSPLTVESVSLIDAHNLTLHGALVYEMAHSQHAMITETAWNLMGDSVPPAARGGIHAVPGAMIAAGQPTTNFRPRYSLNIYEIVPDISATTPGGGWALGESVKYQAAGKTYTVATYTGYAIGVAPAVSKNYCKAQLAAINAAFK